VKPKQPDGPPMTVGNMRHLGEHRLVASCYNGRCSLPKSQPIPSETKTAVRGWVSMVSRNDLSNDLAVCRARAPVPLILESADCFAGHVPRIVIVGHLTRSLHSTVPASNEPSSVVRK
jgi:hypothetical protein